MLFFLMAQNVVYDKNGEKKKFEREELDILFTPSGYKPATKENLVGVFTPLLVDAAFKMTTKYLENRVKKFTAEYTRQQSYLDFADFSIPDFTFIRRLKFSQEGAWEDALKLNFKARLIGDKAMVYTVSAIQLGYSTARTVKDFRKFDYTIEMKINFIVNGEKKSFELSPIVIPSVVFGTTDYSASPAYRTDIIPLPVNAMITEVKLKIIETNPAKLRAEKILSIWNESQEGIKKVISDVLTPTKKDSKPGGNAGTSS